MRREIPLTVASKLVVSSSPDLPAFIDGTVVTELDRIELWSGEDLVDARDYLLPDGRRLRIQVGMPRGFGFLINPLVGLWFAYRQPVAVWVEDRPVTSEAHRWLLWSILGALLVALLAVVAKEPVGVVGGIGAALLGVAFGRWVDARGAVAPSSGRPHEPSESPWAAPGDE